MNNLVFVDCEANGPCPGIGRLTEFGAVHAVSKALFHGDLRTEAMETDEVAAVFERFARWLMTYCPGRPVFVSDNPAYDWQWINYEFHHNLGRNPFGHSARRIGDFYAGLTGDWRNTQKWKNFRITPHDHQPVNDSMGNVEAFERILKGERG